MVELFECEDSIEDMHQSLRNNDVIGLSGSRVFVREILKDLVGSMNTNLDDERYLNLSYDHPDTELGYAFNMNEFSSSEALSIALREYERKNPSWING